MIKESVDAAIAVEWARHANAGNDARGYGPVRGQDAAPTIYEIVDDCRVLSNRRTLKNGARIVELEEMVELERVKVDAYIRGLTDNIKGEVTSFKPANLNEAVCMAHKLMEQKSQARDERVLEGKKRKWLSFKSLSVYYHAQVGKIRHQASKVHLESCPKKVKQEEVGEVRGRTYAIKDAEPKGLNVVTSVFLFNNRYAFVLFDSGFRIGVSWIQLSSSLISILNHIIEIDLMPIELGTFDVIIDMDWLVKHDVVIVCGEKVVRIPYGDKMMIVQNDKGVSRLKVISCIKACKVSCTIARAAGRKIYSPEFITEEHQICLRRRKKDLLEVVKSVSKRSDLRIKDGSRLWPGMKSVARTMSHMRVVCSVWLVRSRDPLLD
ncbi:putative reverse transcriptase domain-containing protein [Tanacetum coccineum]